MRLIMVVLLLVGLMSCANDSKMTKFYSLNLKVDQITSTTGSINNKRKIIVAPVKLAGFLNQDKLVLQIGEHELYFAEYHRWAEPLAKEITQLLINRLNSKAENFQFLKTRFNISQNADYQLMVDIEKFHATDQYKIILSGDFWLLGQEKTIKHNQSFEITKELTRDGYLHSVQSLQEAINQLSDQIIESVNKHYN